jgi:hypothetical protein
MADAAVARLSQGTKVYAEGGHDRVFYQTFGAMPGEQLRKAYACYLSTSSGPVIGTLYLSTARLAFCSDSPVCYQGPAAQPIECMYYKASSSLPFSNRLSFQSVFRIHLSSVQSVIDPPMNVAATSSVPCQYPRVRDQNL